MCLSINSSYALLNVEILADTSSSEHVDCVVKGKICELSE